MRKSPTHVPSLNEVLILLNERKKVEIQGQNLTGYVGEDYDHDESDAKDDDV